MAPNHYPIRVTATGRNGLSSMLGAGIAINLTLTLVIDVLEDYTY
jgi:hypothetical protein